MSRRLIDAMIEGIYEKSRGQRRHFLSTSDAFLFASSAHSCVEGKAGARGSGIFSVDYHEFGSCVDSVEHQRSPLLYCGVSPPDEGKEHFALGVGKLAEGLTPLQIQQVYDCRRLIGSGVALEWSEEGEVYVRCLARRPIYVASGFLDREAMRASGDDSVHVIYQQSSIQVVLKLEFRIFKTLTPSSKFQIHDLYQCAKQLDFWLKSFGSQLASGGHERTVLERQLRREIDAICRVRLSFATEYGTLKRPGIDSTPCWMEVTMERTKLMLERMLEDVFTHGAAHTEHSPADYGMMVDGAGSELGSDSEHPLVIDDC